MNRRIFRPGFQQPADPGIGQRDTTPDSSGYRFDPSRVYGRRAPDESYYYSQRSQTFSSTFFAAVGDGSQLVLPSNPARVYLLVQNLGAADPLYINFGKDASAADGVRIVAGGNIILDYACPTDDVYAFMDAAAAQQFILVSRVILPPE
jgi:hypothetical protein